MLTLTNYFAFSDSIATNYLLIVGLIADGIGILALKYLTLKNDYFTITIKFGIRFIGYVIAFISNNLIITLISFTEKNEISKVEQLMSNINENTCKVPYGINDEKKYEIDNLPYHFTIFATNKENQDKMLEIAEKINIDKIQLKVNDIEIMNARYDSYCLYLSIE